MSASPLPPRDVPEAELVHVAQKARDGGQLLGAAAGEDGERVLLDVAVERGDRGGPRRQLDEDAAPVAGVMRARGDAGALEPVDQAGDRRRAQAGGIAELPGGQ